MKASIFSSCILLLTLTFLIEAAIVERFICPRDDKSDGFYSSPRGCDFFIQCSTDGIAIEKFISPEVDIAEIGCKGHEDCLYPNPGNCNSFIKCEINADNTTVIPVVMPCPGGLQWNDNKKECDWPSSSTCNSQTTSATTTIRNTIPYSTTIQTTSSTTTRTYSTKTETTRTKSTETELLGTDSTENELNTEEPTTLKPSVCQVDEDKSDDTGLDLISLCSGCSVRRLNSHPYKQNKYINCNDGDNNDKISVRKCSEGLLWNSEKLSCDYEIIVKRNLSLIKVSDSEIIVN